MPANHSQSSTVQSVSVLQSSVSGPLVPSKSLSSSTRVTIKKSLPQSHTQLDTNQRIKTNQIQLQLQHKVYTFEKILFFVLFLLVACGFIWLPSDQDIQLQVSLRIQPQQTNAIIQQTNQNPGTCNSHLPYTIQSSQYQLENSYYSWNGKVGQYISVQRYQPGHFIEKHVAMNERCTYPQSILNKTVFYDWSQVLKAFSQTPLLECNIFDKNVYRYEFQVQIPNPQDYIKGIDCRTGTVRQYSKFYILYTKVVEKQNPQQNQYLSSKILTVWAFHPKD